MLKIQIDLSDRSAAITEQSGIQIGSFVFRGNHEDPFDSCNVYDGDVIQLKAVSFPENNWPICYLRGTQSRNDDRKLGFIDEEAHLNQFAAAVLCFTGDPDSIIARKGDS